MKYISKFIFNIKNIKIIEKINEWIRLGYISSFDDLYSENEDLINRIVLYSKEYLDQNDWEY